MILSGWESIFFWAFAFAAIITGLLTVMARNAVHSALFLISTLVSVAALFVLLGAEFIAGVQVLVYVGGEMVLFLFVIMLVNVGTEERGGEELYNRPAQVGASLFFCALLFVGLISAINLSASHFRVQPTGSGQTVEGMAAEQELVRETEQGMVASATGTSKISGDTERVGSSLYRYGGLPFEIASVLLLVAIVGSVLLARTAKQEAAVDDDTPEAFGAMADGETQLTDALPAEHV